MNALPKRDKHWLEIHKYDRLSYSCVSYPNRPFVSFRLSGVLLLCRIIPDTTFGIVSVAALNRVP